MSFPLRRYQGGLWVDAYTTAPIVTGVIKSSFGSSTNALVVSLNGSASTANTGQTITAYIWDFGDNTALGAGKTLTHTYASPGTYSVSLTVRDSGGASSTSTQAVTVKSIALEYLADPTPHFNQFVHPASGVSVAQCIIQSPDTNEWFMSQVHPETTASFGNTDSMRISRMAPDGTLLDQMLCTYGGHGTSIGLEYVNGQMYIWATYFEPAAGSSRVHDIVRFPYTPGTFTRAQIAGLQVKIAGGIYRRIQFDWRNGYCLLTEDPTWKRYRIADIQNGVLSNPVNSLTVTVNPPTLQGLCTYGDSVFYYTGDGADTVAKSLTNPGGPFTLYERSWTTGTQTAKIDLSHMLADSSGNYAGTHVEPESCTIYDPAPGGNPVVNIGLITGQAGTAHTYYVYDFDLLNQTDVVAGRTFELRQTKPTTANVGAGILRPVANVHNGDLTITQNNYLLADTIVNGKVVVQAANVVIENCIIKGPVTDPGAATVNPVWIVNTDNPAVANGPAMIRYCTITGNWRSPNLYGVGSKNYTVEYCDISKVVEGARAAGGSTATPTAAVPPGTTSIAGYSGVQLDNAVYIMQAAIAENFGSLLTKAQEIGVMTAMGESSLRVLSGTTYVGLFQQSSSWGTLAQRMDPYQSAILFFDALKKVSGWETMTPTHAAHAVQVNADPEYYTPYYPPAQTVVAKLAGTSSTASGDSSVLVRGNYIHDLIFYCPDPTNPTNVGPANVAGELLTGTWAGKNWNWSSGVHLLGTVSTGVEIYGNNIVANWSTDPNASTLPLPPAHARLNAVRITAGVNIPVEDNWLDGGEQCLYSPTAATSGSIARNRFGRTMAHFSTADASYYALFVVGTAFDTHDSDRDHNVWVDTGATAYNRSGTGTPPPPAPIPSVTVTGLAGDTTATLTWATSTNGAAVSAVRVSRDGSGGFSVDEPALTGSRTFTGLSNGTTYSLTAAPIVNGVVGTAATVTVMPVATAPTPNGPSGTWSLVFSDDFTGTSVDTTKWNVLQGASINEVTTQAANVSVANSILTLVQSASTSGAAVATGSNWAGTDKFLAQVGDYVEFRARFQGNGSQLYNWPAVWTTGLEPPPWPANGEIDVAEVSGGGVLSANYHGTTNTASFTDPPGYWGGQFHTYGAHRKASSVDIWWDGSLKGSKPTGDTGGPHGIVINIGAGSHGGALSVGGILEVDYVRVFRPTNTGAVMPGPIAGFTQVIAQDFNVDAPVGSFASAYPGWAGYDGNKSGATGVTWNSATTMSVSNSVLRMRNWMSNGVAQVGAFTPIVPGSGAWYQQGWTYGKYIVRFRSDSVHGFKVAWLLWPTNNNWPEGELDFPEANLDGRIAWSAHDTTGNPVNQVAGATSTLMGDGNWHIATTTWTPGLVTYDLDGVVVKSVTDATYIPTTSMRWDLQNETSTDGSVPASTADGSVYIDYVAAYKYNG